MSNNDDIFNIFSSSIPEELEKELGTEDNKEERRIMQLFTTAKRPLTVNEVLVGYYNLFGEVKKRRYIVSKLYRLAKNKKLEKAKKKGQYVLPQYNPIRSTTGDPSIKRPPIDAGGFIHEPEIKSDQSSTTEEPEKEDYDFV
jgi:hypothetical protein